MSDQDTPPPMDDDNPQGGPPPGGDIPPAQEPGVPPSDVPPAGTVPGAAVALGQGKLSETDEKTMSMLAHILGGVTCILGPLIIWLIKKDESPFVDDQGKEATNFQITILIGYVASSVLAMIPVVGCVSFLFYPTIAIVSLVFAILGGLEANKGLAYRYPFALRLIS